MIVLMSILCIFSLIYYIIIILDCGLNASFSGFWLALCVITGAAAAWLKHLRKQGKRLPGVLKIGVMAVGLCLLAVFLVVEARLIGTALRQDPGGADYLIVLGAQVRGKVPSRILYKRTARAATYLKKNPGTQVIVSGGQGEGEEITEAACMKQLLTEMGIEPERIRMEEASRNTFENISNSLALCGSEKRVVIVTCGYHMYRAQKIAQACGARNIGGAASALDPVLFINYYVREFFAVIKYSLDGRI